LRQPLARRVDELGRELVLAVADHAFGGGGDLALGEAEVVDERRAAIARLT